jgi:hypothetical protein
MTSPVPAPSPPALRYEVRPSPLKAWNENAPDEVVPVGENAPGLGDFLQALNPLQHLPVIGTAYRALTGATIEPAARVVGGLIFGGPLGMLGSLVNAFVEENSGADVGEHFLAMVGAGKAPTPNGTPPAPPTAPADPDGDVAKLHFASAGSAARGSFENGGLLATWIAEGAPRGQDWASVPAAAPAQTASAGGIPVRMNAATAEAVATVPPPTTAPAPAPARADPATTPVAASGHASGKGKSLQEYRAAAVVPAGFRAAAAAPVDSFGLNRRAEDIRRFAAQSQTVALQAQDVARGGDAAAPQNYFSAAMLAGLERYRDMQRRRDAAAPADDI